MAYSLEIYTPQKNVYSGMVDTLVADGLEGKFGVWSNHAPMLAALAFGLLSFKEEGGKSRRFVVSDGYFEVEKNKAVILVDTAEETDEIDVERAKAALERAQARLKEQQDDIDVVRAKTAMHRAMIRIKAAGR